VERFKPDPLGTQHKVNRININAILVKVFHLSHVDYLILYIQIVIML